MATPFCEQCGKPISPDAVFCPSCGRKIQTGASSPLVKVEFTIESGLWSAGKLKTLVSEIDNHYARLKSETGQKLNFECSKQSWQSNLRVTVEGASEVVRDFLRRIRATTNKLGLRGVPEHWDELP